MSPFYSMLDYLYAIFICLHCISFVSMLYFVILYSTSFDLYGMSCYF